MAAPQRKRSSLFGFLSYGKLESEPELELQRPSGVQEDAIHLEVPGGESADAASPSPMSLKKPKVVAAAVAVALLVTVGVVWAIQIAQRDLTEGAARTSLDPQKIESGCFVGEDFNGFDLSSTGGVSDATACQKMCAETNGCQYFTFIVATAPGLETYRNWCYLKSARNAQPAQAGWQVLSGPRSCDTPEPGQCAACSAGAVCCNPKSNDVCPGNVACCDCGSDACTCPGSSPSAPTLFPTAPSPTHKPSPPTTRPPTAPTPVRTGSACAAGGDDFGVPLLEQKGVAASFWKYKWGGAPYGTPDDIAGVLQVVNGGTEDMWIRYGGAGIGKGGAYDWTQYLTTASALNNNQAHATNQLGENGMQGQGDAFLLRPGEYQLVPFAASACWLGGSLGCCEHGNGCDVSPAGRGSGQDATIFGQPNTLFEWTAPGVWDASLVDGFSLPMKVEVDGCGFPGQGSKEDCKGSDGAVHLAFDKEQCPNPILNQDGNYVGCKSMCGCQYNAASLNQETDPACPDMLPRSQIENQPFGPGGYCGCADSSCVKWLDDLFDGDKAGLRYCDAITSMTHGSDGKRPVYCQAYDDNAGTRSYGNGIIKVTLCNDGFEFAKDKSGTC